MSDDWLVRAVARIDGMRRALLDGADAFAPPGERWRGALFHVSGGSTLARATAGLGGVAYLWLGLRKQARDGRSTHAERRDVAMDRRTIWLGAIEGFVWVGALWFFAPWEWALAVTLVTAAINGGVAGHAAQMLNLGDADGD